MGRAHLAVVLLITVLAAVWGGLHAAPKTPDQPPVGPFGLSRITTAEGTPADLDSFTPSETCGVCHERQLKELQGAMHLAAHVDPFYRGFAELARKEAGDKVYAYCSGCHSAAGVVSGLIPRKHDPALPAEAKAGVTCDVCHQVSRLTGTEGPWGEPGNASFVLQPGQVKFAASGTFQKNRAHSGEQRGFFARAEFCSSCHTVIHPLNGLRIENTYGEWKDSVYAKNAVQCQDCHMRSVEEMKQVAETLKPVIVKGPRVINGPERDIRRHYFVGGNTNADRLAGDKAHAALAEGFLKSAARIEVKAPDGFTPGTKLPLEVIVHNIAAGHNLPTGVTELRQMWVDLQVLDANGKTVFRSPTLDGHGELSPEAIWFGAVAVDQSGKVTVRPWEMARFARRQTVPPKGSIATQLAPSLPPQLAGPITISARLLYRSAPPHAVALSMPQKPFTPNIVEMTTTTARVAVKAKDGARNSR